MGVLSIRQNPISGAENTANSIKTSLSSWNGCMSKAYCKWPVIVGIIIGSLIVLSILFCVVRCLCFGAECACCCFRCCGGGRRRGYKQQPPPPSNYPPPQPYNQPYNQPYRSPPPLAYQSPQPQYNAGQAQFARFDVSKPANEDSLPAMPTWEDASSRKVETVENAESHEMDKLDDNGLAPSGAPKLPSFETSPADERDSFIGVSHGDSSSGYRGSAPAPAQAGYGNQAYGGYTGGYAPANQRGPQTSPPPQGAGAYGNRPGYDRNPSYGSQQRRSPGSPPQAQGFGNQQYGEQPPYGRQNSYGDAYGSQRDQSSPVYAPSGSTAYDPPANNQYHAYSAPSNNAGYAAYNPGGQQSTQGYGNEGYGGPRKPVQGSWRDV